MFDGSGKFLKQVSQDEVNNENAGAGISIATCMVMFYLLWTFVVVPTARRKQSPLKHQAMKQGIKRLMADMQSKYQHAVPHESYNLFHEHNEEDYGVNERLGNEGDTNRLLLSPSRLGLSD